MGHGPCVVESTDVTGQILGTFAGLTESWFSKKCSMQVLLQPIDVMMSMFEFISRILYGRKTAIWKKKQFGARYYDFHLPLSFQSSELIGFSNST